MTGPKIRTAEARDRDAIVELVEEAFTSDGRDGHEEVDVVVSTWELGAAPRDLELVAVDEGVIVGHVLAARGDLSGREVVAVAPLAVRVAHQGSGVGTALMTELLVRAEAAGLPLLLLLGDPRYYGRFGFEPSGPHGISYAPVGNGSPYFQVRRFSGFDRSYEGRFTYCWEVGGD